jgi:hypothetical protein
MEASGWRGRCGRQSRLKSSDHRHRWSTSRSSPAEPSACRVRARARRRRHGAAESRAARAVATRRRSSRTGAASGPASRRDAASGSSRAAVRTDAPSGEGSRPAHLRRTAKEEIAMDTLGSGLHRERVARVAPSPMAGRAAKADDPTNVAAVRARWALTRIAVRRLVRHRSGPFPAGQNASTTAHPTSWDHDRASSCTMSIASSLLRGVLS